MKLYKKLLIGCGALACLAAAVALVLYAVAPLGPQGLQALRNAEPDNPAAVAERIMASKAQESPEERAASAAKADEKAGAGTSFEARRVLVSFVRGVGEDEARAALAESPALEGDALEAQDFGAEVVAMEAQVAPEFTVAEAQEVLEADPRVSGAQPNYYYTLADADEGTGAGSQGTASSTKAAAGKAPQSTTTNDQYRSVQKHLGQIKAYEAWDYAKADHEVTVAIIDTGIQMDHPDLKANIVDPRDIVGDDRTDYTDSVPDDSPDDVMGHGTHCAGLAAGVAGNGIGIAGVSYNARVMPLKVFYYSDSVQNYTCTSMDILSAYNWLMDHAEEDNVRVASMSLGGVEDYDESEEGQAARRQDDLCMQAVQTAYDVYGIVTVAAAGNDGVEQANWPANYGPCIGVIALDESGTARASYSNYGSNNKIAAPGTSIFSTVPAGSSYADAAYSDDENGSYGYMSGTSMATPIVAGAMALLFSADPSLTAQEAEDVLCNTATDLGAEGWDKETGYGALDAERMVKSVALEDVAEIDGLPSVAVVGSELELSGTPLASGSDGSSGSAGKLRNDEVSYTLLDPGETGASLSGALFRASASGTATIRATVAEGGAYCTDYTQDFQISVVEGSLPEHGAIEGLEASYTYTGSAIEPSFAVTVEGTAIREGEDYTVSYSGNTEVGTATVTVTGAGAFSGTLSASFEVVPATLEAASIGAIPEQRYTGGAIEPEPVVTMGGATLAKGSDYTLSYSDNTEVGTAKVTVSGVGNYTGSRELSFRIVKGSIAGGGLYFAKTWTYTGSAIEPVPTVTVDGRALTAGADFETSYVNNVDAGIAGLVVIGTGSYGGTLSASFVIEPAGIGDADVSAIADQGYTGAAVEPALSVSLGGRALVAGRDYTVSYSDNVAPGTATATMTGTGNYTGTKTASFQIVAASGAASSAGGSAGTASGTGASAGASAGTEASVGDPSVPKAGMSVAKGGVVCKLVRTKTGTLVASVTGLKNAKAAKATVPAKVRIAGKSFRVKRIAKRAFYKRVKLKRLTVKSRAIAKVGKKAFAKTRATLVVKVPKGKKSSYRKLFVKAGLSKKATVK